MGGWRACGMGAARAARAGWPARALSFTPRGRPAGPPPHMDPADVRAAVAAFLSAFVSETIAARGLYPAAAFAPRSIFGAAARRATHPGLAAYVDKATA